MREAFARGAFDGRWTLNGIGTSGSGGSLDVGGGATLELLPRAAQDDYADLLREHDVGLALMYTPHPSLVPIEMASAGMLDRHQHIREQDGGGARGDLAEPDRGRADVDAVADALCAAAGAAGDVERRVRGSRVDWSRDWDESFNDKLLAKIAGFLGA